MLTRLTRTHTHTPIGRSNLMGEGNGTSSLTTALPEQNATHACKTQWHSDYAYHTCLATNTL